MQLFLRTWRTRDQFGSQSNSRAGACAARSSERAGVAAEPSGQRVRGIRRGICTAGANPAG